MSTRWYSPAVNVRGGQQGFRDHGGLSFLDGEPSRLLDRLGRVSYATSIYALVETPRPGGC